MFDVTTDGRQGSPTARVTARGYRQRHNRGRPTILLVVLVCVLGLLIGLQHALGGTDGSQQSGRGKLNGIYPPDTLPKSFAVDATNSIELGTRFVVDSPGQVVGVRFFRSPGDRGENSVSLWSADGRRLAFKRLVPSRGYGWRVVDFPRPITIGHGGAFVVSFHTTTGAYAINERAYARGDLGSGVVHAKSGAYRYGPSSYPQGSYRDSDYYVEPLFRQWRSAPTGQSADKNKSTALRKPCDRRSGIPEGWPDACDTGSRGSLRHVPGWTITVDGTTVQDLAIDGQLNIKADDVTIRNVHVKSTGDFGILVGGANTRIEDSTIEGQVGTSAGIAPMENGQFTASRVNVFNAEDGVRLADNSTLRDSFVHDLLGTRDSHYDSVTADGYRGWEIVDNTILNEHSNTAVVWVGDPRYGPSSGVMQRNYLAGGGFTVYAGPGAPPGIKVLDNLFSTRYFPASGYWGPVAKWYPAGNAWDGNKWADGPNAGRRVDP